VRAAVKKAYIRLPSLVQWLVRTAIISPLRWYFRYAPTTVGKDTLWKLASHLWWIEAPSVVARTVSGAYLRVDARDIVGRYLYYFGVWEPNLTAWLEQSLEPGDVFVDVGANVGYFSVLAGRLVGDGGVVAFEAHPRTFELLEENVHRNGLVNVRTVCAAVWDAPAMLELFSTAGATVGASTVFTEWADRWNLSTVGSVPANRLSTLLTAEELAAARVIKVDVEGAELRVLRGVAGALGKCRDDLEIAVEVAPQLIARDGGSWDEMCQMLGEHGYTPRLMRNDYSARAYYRRGDVSSLEPMKVPARAEQFDVVFSRRSHP
jgi:FkbM family methyltransferase